MSIINIEDFLKTFQLHQGITFISQFRICKMSINPFDN